jgi:hypothetical protein
MRDNLILSLIIFTSTSKSSNIIYKINIKFIAINETFEIEWLKKYARNKYQQHFEPQTKRSSEIRKWINIILQKTDATH